MLRIKSRSDNTTGDFDGDLMMITDNEVLVNNYRNLPAIMCVQRKATKIVPTEDDLIKSNLESFGNDIGKTTNWVTSMFEVQSKYDEGSEEYKILDYRIMCGQLYQQNVIDRTKGIIAKPMPRSWHDWHEANRVDESKRELYKNIVADKKPYFMRYIYPELSKQYNEYIRNTNRNALRLFQMTVDEMQRMPYSALSERQKEFLAQYDKRMPVGVGPCVVNKICYRFEEEFDSVSSRRDKGCLYDYTRMKSNVGYSKYQFDTIRKLYDEYNKRVKSYKVFSYYERTDDDEAAVMIAGMKDEFARQCEIVCQNGDVLCDIVLDICYTKNTSKRFSWDMSADAIVDNLLSLNDGIIEFPVKDSSGDIQYGGNAFRVVSMNVEDLINGNCA